MKGCISLLLISLFFSSHAWGAEHIKLIAHPQLKQEVISHTGIRAIFSMRLRTWSDGSPVHVFVLNDHSPTHTTFSKEILGVFPHQLRRGWDRLVFSGTGQAPTEVSSEAMMRKRVTETPGAIGYLFEDEVDETIRTIEVQ